MLRRLAFICLVMIGVGSVAPAAQWLNHPTPGIPRLPNGKPDLNAPAPKTADGRPDLSGIFYLEATCPPSGCSDDYQAGPEFINFGAKLPGGLPYQPWAAALVKERTAELYKDDPVGFCKPSGVLRLLTFPPPRTLVQMPGLFLILSSATSRSDRSSPTDVRCPPIPRRRGMATRWAAGKATRSWSRRSACETARGSIAAVAR
jgi:hypothetical protein